jgi:serine/threonine protein kinase
MPHIHGQHLDAWRDLQKPSQTVILELFAKLCRAVHYAHQRGIIHRDVNPSNIIVQPNDKVKIFDFGLACPIGTQDFANTGTADYMAPEQITGDPVDPRTDIYALGITAYELVVGKGPFPKNSPKELLDHHLIRDIPDPKQVVPGLPDELGTFIRRAARRDPAQRYQDARQAISTILPLLNQAELLHDKQSVDIRPSESGICRKYASANSI